MPKRDNDVNPISQIDSILPKLRNAKYIMKSDLSQAFYQIVITKEHRNKNNFWNPWSRDFPIQTPSFRPCNGPLSLQRTMDSLKGPKMDPHVFKYLDDIIIVTDTFEEHLEWLDKVLDVLKGANLTINPDKSEF